MKPLIVWLFLCIVWGSTWIFIKLGLDFLPPVTFAALRFTVACALLYPILRFQRISIPSIREHWRFIVLTGTLQFFLNYGLLFWGEQFISSGLAAVLQATIPAFGLILARIYVGEEITGLKIASILLGIAGVGVIFREQLSLNGEMAFFGSLAVVLGAFGASYASVLTKARGLSFHPAGLVFLQMLIGHIPLWIVGLYREGNPASFRWSPLAILCVVYLAIVGSIVAFWLYYWLLSKIDVTRAMMIAFVTPLIAVIVGSFFGEKLELQTLLGGAMILVSVFLIVIRPLIRRAKG
ncbi:MAG: EamA family transporter [Acidobacteria bacterium]|nr:EamA family transporter [Acidobacteriota bacterium]MBK8150413.1 EamA family transporter [Acidobacteriota bacterium]MBK8811410.1 EamA family transporter [Acidobacteriota bacterium]